MSFKDWLLRLEVGTSTACVASFARPAFPPVRRVPVPDPPRRRKRKVHGD